MGRLARLWGLRHQPAPPAVAESNQTPDALYEGGRLGRLELVFLHTARAGAGPVRRFLEKHYGAALRTEYNTQPPQHRFEPGEIKSWIDWVSRMIPNSGRALATNFLVQPQDVGYTIRPIRFITLVREPIARIGGEFLAFRRDIEARGGADAQTRKIADNIVHFSDTMMRNDYLVRFFSNMDLCDPIEDRHMSSAPIPLLRGSTSWAATKVHNRSRGNCSRWMYSAGAPMPMLALRSRNVAGFSGAGRRAGLATRPRNTAATGGAQLSGPVALSLDRERAA